MQLQSLLILFSHNDIFLEGFHDHLLVDTPNGILAAIQPPPTAFIPSKGSFIETGAPLH